MIWLSNSTIARLRDQLRTRGQRPSVAIGGAPLTPDEAEQATVAAEYGPICEAMYLMMSADGKITDDEREVLKGALRNLSGDTIRGVHIESMLATSTKNSETEGREARLKEVIALLHEDAARAEVAFVLAAAIAFAEGLGIDESRANELLDSVEADLAERPA